MGKIRRKFEAEFKRQLVAQIEAGALTVGQAARDQQLSRSLVERWRERCYLTGKSVSVTDVERTMSGACLGLEDDGSLLIQTEAGPQRCYAGVVNVVE